MPAQISHIAECKSNRPKERGSGRSHRKATIGRGVAEGDTEAAPKVVIVNEQFIRQFLSNAEPIGRRFSPGNKSSEEMEIVGVVSDARYFDLGREAPATTYVPWLQNLDLNNAMHFEVRTASDPTKLMSAVRRVAQDMDNKPRAL